LRLAGAYLERGVRDAGDTEAREALSWGATLAGIAFGNSGVHLPHAMSYAVAGLVRDYRCDGYPAEEAMVPHGISVVVGAPSVFRATARALPERHREAAVLLGADARGAGPGDEGELLAKEIIRLMRATSVPGGLQPLGYDARDLDALTRGAIVQSRLVQNAPVPVDDAAMRALFEGALSYA
jgi:alcohol dehydrogenase class IV